MPWADAEYRKEYQKQYYEKNKDRIKAQMRERYENNAEVRGRRRKYNRSYMENVAESLMLYRATRRAKAAGLPITIDLSDIVIPEFCPVLGVRMKVGASRSGGHSPSLDRIDPSKGYVKGNVVVISALANRIKNNATAEQVAAVARWMASVVQNQPAG